MKTTVKKTVEFTLVLDGDEAAWLHGIMQNPLHGQRPAEESTEEGSMRHLFWEATNPAKH